MNIFISYASEDRNAAEHVHYALCNAGHETFFDRASLQPGGDYTGTIEGCIQEADALVFLISEHSLAPGKFTLTELKLAREQWPSAAGRVLPVMLGKVPFGKLPPYLASVTVLEPEGNLPAEVAMAVSRLAEIWEAEAEEGGVAAEVTDLVVTHDAEFEAADGSTEPALQFTVSVELSGAAGSEVWVAVRICDADGEYLVGDPDSDFTDDEGVVYVESDAASIEDDEGSFDFDDLLLPYPALCLPDDGGRKRHALTAVAEVYVDDELVAESEPQAFSVRG